MTLSVCKRFSFEAAHQLKYHKGKCKNLHGHHYEFEVEVSGSLNGDQEASSYQMIIDFGDLKELVGRKVIDKLDHQDLTDFFSFGTPEFNYIAATAERMALWIAEQLEWEISGLGTDAKLIRVQVWETPGSSAIWRA